MSLREQHVTGAQTTTCAQWTLHEHVRNKEERPDWYEWMRWSGPKLLFFLQRQMMKWNYMKKKDGADSQPNSSAAALWRDTKILKDIWEIAKLMHSWDSHFQANHPAEYDSIKLQWMTGQFDETLLPVVYSKRTGFTAGEFLFLHAMRLNSPAAGVNFLVDADHEQKVKVFLALLHAVRQEQSDWRLFMAMLRAWRSQEAGARGRAADEVERVLSSMFDEFKKTWFLILQAPCPKDFATPFLRVRRRVGAISTPAVTESEVPAIIYWSVAEMGATASLCMAKSLDAISDRLKTSAHYACAVLIGPSQPHHGKTSHVDPALMAAAVPEHLKMWRMEIAKPQYEMALPVECWAHMARQHWNSRIVKS